MGKSTKKGVSEVSGAVMGGAVGAAIGGPVGAAAGAILTSITNNLMSKMWVERQLRLEGAVHEAAKLLDLSTDKLAESLDTPNGRLFLPSMLQSAQSAKSELKIDLLASAIARLAQGVEAEENAEFILIAQALEAIEEPHIIVLHRLSREGDRYSGVLDSELARSFSGGVTYCYAILETLKGLGMCGPKSAQSDDPDEDQEWIIWDFGLRFLDLLSNRKIIESLEGAPGS